MSVDKIFENLKESNNSLYVWGAGSISIRLCDHLKNKGLNVKGRFININKNDCSITPSIYDVFELAELLDKEDAIDVVVGHGHPEYSEQLKKYHQIKNIYNFINPYPYYPGLKSSFLNDKKDKYKKIKSILYDDLSRVALDSYFEVNDTNDYTVLMKDGLIINNMFDLKDMNFSNEEIFVDIGAFDGDTVKQFIKKVDNKYKEIYAIEPNFNSFKLLKEMANNYKNINCYMLGLSDHDDILCLGRSENESSFLFDDSNDENIKVDVKTLDEIFNDKEYPTTIKIFTPFMVYNILKGSKNIISNNKPKLIINLGSGDDRDIFEIIEYIISLNKNYKLVLRYDMLLPVRLFLFCF